MKTKSKTKTRKAIITQKELALIAYKHFCRAKFKAKKELCVAFAELCDKAEKEWGFEWETAFRTLDYVGKTYFPNG